MTTAETPERGYPRKKSRFFSKAVGKKLGIRERNWVDAKKNRKFFKNGETKTACPGEKLGSGENFRIS